MNKFFTAILLTELLFSYSALAEDSKAFTQQSDPQNASSLTTIEPSKDENKNELLVSTSTAALQGTVADSSSSNTFNANIGYFRALNKMLQLGGSVAYYYDQYSNNYSDKSSNNRYTLSVGPTFNLVTENGLENSYFLRPMILYSESRGSSSYTDSSYKYESFTSGFSLEAGKRFSLFSNIAFSPSVKVTAEKTNYSTGYYNRYSFNFLSASLLW